MTSEAQILAHAKKECRRLGLLFHRIHMAKGAETGWPDVEILGQNRGILFMETKRLGKPLLAIQAYRAQKIEEYGHRWCKPDTKEAVTAALEQFSKECGRA